MEGHPSPGCAHLGFPVSWNTADTEPSRCPKRLPFWVSFVLDRASAQLVPGDLLGRGPQERGTILEAEPLPTRPPHLSLIHPSLRIRTERLIATRAQSPGLGPRLGQNPNSGKTADMPTCSAAASCWTDTPSQAARQEGSPSPRPGLLCPLLCPVPRPRSWYGALLLPHPTQAERQEALSSLSHPHPHQGHGGVGKGGTRDQGKTLGLGHLSHRRFLPTGEGTAARVLTGGGEGQQRNRGSSWSTPIITLAPGAPAHAFWGGLHQ